MFRLGAEATSAPGVQQTCFSSIRFPKSPGMRTSYALVTSPTRASTVSIDLPFASGFHRRVPGSRAPNARADVRPLWQSVLNHETNNSTLVQSALPWRAPSWGGPQTHRPAFVGAPSGATAIRETDSDPRHHA